MLNELKNMLDDISGYWGLKLPGEKAMSARACVLEHIEDQTKGARPLANHLNYSYYDTTQELFFNEDDTVGFMMELSPIVGSSNDLEKNFNLFFNNELPDGVHMQFLLVAGHDIEDQLELWKRARNKSGNKCLSKLTAYREHYLRARSKDFCNADGRMGRDFRIYVSCSMKLSSRDSRRKLEETVTFKKKLFSKFKALKLSPRMRDAEDLMYLASDILQMEMGSKNRKKYDPFNPLSEQILKPLHRTRLEEETIIHEESNLATKCFYPTSLPEEFSLMQMIELLGREDESMTIPARFIISYSLASNLGAGGQSKIISQGMRAIYAAEQWYTRHDINLKKEATEWREVMGRHKAGEKFLTESMAVIITAPVEHIDIAAETLKSLYNSRDWQLGINKNLQLISLLSILPMQQAAYWNILRMFQLVKVVLSREVVAKIPIHGEWKGAPQSGVLLLGRRGQLFNWTPFYRVGGAGNFNVCVMAPAGGGKSVFLQELATSMMCQGVAVFILDIGGSYQNICDLVDGVNIRFNASNEMSLNPFSGLAGNGLKYVRAGEMLKSGKEFELVCEETGLSQDLLTAYIEGLSEQGSEAEKEQNTIEILKIGKSFVTKDSIIYARSIIAAMCGVKGNAHLEALIDAAINKGIEDYGSDLDITKLALILNSQESVENAKVLAETLYPFTEKGLHGRYFKLGKVANFKELITNFEFEEIKNDPVLLGVVLQVILMQITMQFLCGDRSKQFVLIVDEAWMILDFCAPFLEAFARTVRKYGGSLITCVQDLSSFHKGAPQKAILENSSWKAVLKQSRLEAFNNDDEFKGHVPLIASVTKEASGKYSEVLLQTSGLTIVGRLVLDPYSVALYSTESEDYNFLSRCRESEMTKDEAVESLSKKYGELPNLDVKLKSSAATTNIINATVTTAATVATTNINDNSNINTTTNTANATANVFEEESNATY